MELAVSDPPDRVCCLIADKATSTGWPSFVVDSPTTDGSLILPLCLTTNNLRSATVSQERHCKRNDRCLFGRSRVRRLSPVIFLVPEGNLQFGS